MRLTALGEYCSQLLPAGPGNDRQLGIGRLAPRGSDRAPTALMRAVAAPTHGGPGGAAQAAHWPLTGRSFGAHPFDGCREFVPKGMEAPACVARHPVHLQRSALSFEGGMAVP